MPGVRGRAFGSLRKPRRDLAGAPAAVRASLPKLGQEDILRGERAAPNPAEDRPRLVPVPAPEQRPMRLVLDQCLAGAPSQLLARPPDRVRNVARQDRGRQCPRQRLSAFQG